MEILLIVDQPLYHACKIVTLHIYNIHRPQLYNYVGMYVLLLSLDGKELFSNIAWDCYTCRASLKVTFSFTPPALHLKLRLVHLSAN